MNLALLKELLRVLGKFTRQENNIDAEIFYITCNLFKKPSPVLIPAQHQSKIAQY